MRHRSLPPERRCDPAREGGKGGGGPKKKNCTYSDGSYRISKRSPEAARTELIVANALRYAEDLKKNAGENPAGAGGDAATKAWSASALSLLSECV